MKNSNQLISGSVAAAVLAIALTVTTAWAGDEKLSSELRSINAGPDLEVIVQYKVAPTGAQNGKVAALGGSLHAEMSNVKASWYSIPASQLKTLSDDPDVAYISPNRRLKGMLNITGPTVHSDVANAQGYTGTGIGVAVVDSGVSDMSEFHNGQSRIVYQQSFVPNFSNLNIACPASGAQAGVWYGASLNVQGGIAPFTVSINAGSLPLGLSLNAATGSITGVPLIATSGSALVFSANVTDSWGNTVTQICNMNVSQAQNGSSHQLQLNCPGSGAEANAWFDSLLNAQGGVPPYRFSIGSGALPAGVTMSASTGEIAGTPAASTAGSQTTFGITMKDTAGSSVGQSCNMIVGQAQQAQVTGTADQFGHGSHVAGIIGSNGDGEVYIGIAPGVNIVSLRVLDQNGNGSDATVIAGIDAAISLAKTYNIRVLNLSLGRQIFESSTLDPLCQAVEAAWHAGIVVVVAAGNDGRDNSAGTHGYGTITAPGNDPYVITVGAMKTEGTTTRTDDMIASYSSKGPTAFDFYAKPDIVAPGNLIVSTMQAGQTLSQEYPQNRVDGDFFILSGTSMAAPVVSGAAVLLLQKNPSLTPDRVKALLMKDATRNFPASSTAVDPTTGLAYTSYYDIFTVGAGYLDIEAALNDTTAMTGTAISPAVTYDAATNSIDLLGVGATNMVPGANTIWGTNVVTGNHVIWGNHAIWGTQVILGAGSIFSEHVIWGTNVVWDETTTDSALSTPISVLGEQ